MSKIKTIQVKNLKAISELTADFNGCTVIVTGNRKGCQRKRLPIIN